MEILQNKYFIIYITGVLVALLLQIFSRVVQYTLSFISKETIIIKNLEKIGEPDKRTFSQKSIEYFRNLAIGISLSWINAIGVSVTLIFLLINFIRTKLQSTPESIKELRFPLYNNPNLSRESVWAFNYALLIKGGERTQDPSGVVYSIFEIIQYYPSFNKKMALEILSGLHVIDNMSIDSILARIHDMES